MGLLNKSNHKVERKVATKKTQVIEKKEDYSNGSKRNASFFNQLLEG